MVDAFAVDAGVRRALVNLLLTVGARVPSETLANVAVHFVVALSVHARVGSALVDVCSKVSWTNNSQDQN